MKNRVTLSFLLSGSFLETALIIRGAADNITVFTAKEDLKSKSNRKNLSQFLRSSIQKIADKSERKFFKADGGLIIPSNMHEGVDQLFLTIEPSYKFNTALLSLSEEFSGNVAKSQLRDTMAEIVWETTAFQKSPTEVINQISNNHIDIIVMGGGFDGGNTRETVMLSEIVSLIEVPTEVRPYFIFAGNEEAIPLFQKHISKKVQFYRAQNFLSQKSDARVLSCGELIENLYLQKCIGGCDADNVIRMIPPKNIALLQQRMPMFLRIACALDSKNAAFIHFAEHNFIYTVLLFDESREYAIKGIVGGDIDSVQYYENKKNKIESLDIKKSLKNSLYNRRIGISHHSMSIVEIDATLQAYFAVMLKKIYYKISENCDIQQVPAIGKFYLTGFEQFGEVSIELLLRSFSQAFEIPILTEVIIPGKEALHLPVLAAPDKVTGEGTIHELLPSTLNFCGYILIPHGSYKNGEKAAMFLRKTEDGEEKKELLWGEQYAISLHAGGAIEISAYGNVSFGFYNKKQVLFESLEDRSESYLIIDLKKRNKTNV